MFASRWFSLDPDALRAVAVSSTDFRVLIAFGEGKRAMMKRFRMTLLGLGLSGIVSGGIFVAREVLNPDAGLSCNRRKCSWI